MPVDDARPPLDSVDRALRLIEALQDGRSLTVQAAADLLGVAPSTAHRLLSALKFRQFAEQAGDRGYRAGLAVRRGMGSTSHHDAIKSAARPALERLHEDIDETAQVMVRLGTQIQFLDGIQSERPLRVAVRIGDRLPAHTSAGGKALLAELTSADLEDLYVDGLPVWQTAALTSVEELRRALTVVRRAGHGVNHDETESGVSGVGVVVRDSQGNGVAALTLAIPTARFARLDVASYAELLHAAARSVETALAL